MARTKIDKEEESVVEAPVVEAPAETPAHKAFATLIEAYKVQNPVKYEQKKKALEAHLSTL